MDTQKKIALNMGLFLGLALTLLITMIYVIDLSLITNGWVLFLNISFITIFCSISAYQYKKKLGGFISFKVSFTSFFISLAVGFFISTLFSILLFNLIDLEAKTIVTEHVIKYTVEMKQKFGTPAKEINDTINEMRDSNSFGILSQIKGFFTNLVLYSIIGLIASLVIKREPPQSL